MCIVDDIVNIVLINVGGVLVWMKDVGVVDIGCELCIGVVMLNGEEVVFGMVFMLMGENSCMVLKVVVVKMEDVNCMLLVGVKVILVYDCMVFVEKVVVMVKKNLFEGVVFVIVVLFLFFGNICVVLIIVFVILLLMLMIFIGMVNVKVSVNLMSFGVFDFGIIVDGVVVIVENCVWWFVYV